MQESARLCCGPMAESSGPIAKTSGRMRLGMQQLVSDLAPVRKENEHAFLIADVLCFACDMLCYAVICSAML